MAARIIDEIAATLRQRGRVDLIRHLTSAQPLSRQPRRSRRHRRPSRYIIAALIKTGRPDLAIQVARYVVRRSAVVTATIQLSQQGNEWVVSAPTYQQIVDALPTIKKLGFRYRPTDKTWRMPATKFTDKTRKQLEPFMSGGPGKPKQKDVSAIKKEVEKLLRPLLHHEFFNVAIELTSFGLSGDTYSIREQIKAAGGRWNPAAKSWWFDYDEVNLSRLADIVKDISKRETVQQKKVETVEHAIKPLLDIRWDIITCKIIDQDLEISPLREYQNVIKNFLRVEHYFPGARWKDDVWRVPLAEIDGRKIQPFIAAVEDLQIQYKAKDELKVERAVPKVGGAKYVWSKGSGYGGEVIEPGEVIKSGKKHLQEGWPEYITVIKTTKNFYREDGMSFGVGEDRGYMYTYHCREATDQEAATKRAEDLAHKSKQDALKRLQEIGKYIQTNGKYPPAWADPKGERYMLDETGLLYGGGSWFIVQGPVVWFVRNNGADGDDWSHNNVRTGGAGAIGWFVLNNDIALEIAALMTALGRKQK